jgi:hypothetical protein
MRIGMQRIHHLWPIERDNAQAPFVAHVAELMGHGVSFLFSTLGNRLIAGQHQFPQRV